MAVFKLRRTLLLAFALVPLTCSGGLGAGDAKLMTAVGALTSWRFVLWATGCTAIVGAALAVFWLCLKGGARDALRRSFKSTREERREAVAQSDPQATLPYAVAICIGSIWGLYMFYSYTGTYPW